MRTFITLLFVFAGLSIQAQTKSLKKSPKLSEASPSEAGISAERLSIIDNMLNKAIANDEIPGAVALIVRNNKIVYHKAFGKADSEKSKKLGKDDIFRIASQTKAITATAVMMLWEEGKFRLDDPISKYIPEFKNPQVLESFNDTDSTYTAKPAKNEITIRHLLTHTSGLGYGIIDPDERFRKIYQKAEIIDAFTSEPVTIKENILKLAKLPLHFNPGEKYLYSEGLDVLGYFVEIVSEMPFDKFLQKRLFEPLGMNDTWFYLPSSKANRLVAVQTIKDDKWVNFQKTPYYDPDYPIKGAKTFFSGGAGLSSTAKDYAIFLQMYLNKGEYNGIRFLSRTTIRTIMANQITNFWGDKADAYYGLAFGVLNSNAIATGGKGSEGTFEWGGYFNTQYFADPKEKVIGILMKQTQVTPGPGITLAGSFDSWFFKLLMTKIVNFDIF